MGWVCQCVGAIESVQNAYHRFSVNSIRLATVHKIYIQLKKMYVYVNIHIYISLLIHASCQK